MIYFYSSSHGLLKTLHCVLPDHLLEPSFQYQSETESVPMHLYLIYRFLDALGGYQKNEIEKVQYWYFRALNPFWVQIFWQSIKFDLKSNASIIAIIASFKSCSFLRTNHQTLVCF